MHCGTLAARGVQPKQEMLSGGSLLLFGRLFGPKRRACFFWEALWAKEAGSGSGFLGLRDFFCVLAILSRMDREGMKPLKQLTPVF